MKTIKLTSMLVLAALSGSLAAQTLVTVNGTKIDSKDIDAQVKMLQSQSNGQIQDSPQLRDNLTRRQITGIIIGQEAKRLKLHESTEYKQAIEQARAAAKEQGADKKPNFKQEWAAYENDLLSQAYVAHIVRSNPVTEADVKTAYNDFSNFYKGSSEIQLGEIINRDNTVIQKALSELKNKKSFKTVAGQYSADPQAKQTGGISSGYVNLKDLEQGAPVVYNAVKDLRKGSYTDVMQSQDGLYAIFYVNDKRAAKIPSLDEVKESLGRDLQAARIDQAIQALYGKADVKPAK
ncbi:peptidyl-prolyl cis-trans isomerase [Neisseria sp. S1]|uniref:peptidylprolyl isomerase n=1 Tax=Neisseria sp. S1 TaxID=3318354 RepID=UPI003A86294F